MSYLYEESDHARIYKQFRPSYPGCLYDIIIDYCKKYRNAFDLCVDLGCGSGQSTLALAQYFSSIIGIDVSEAQIREAKADMAKSDNVQCKVNSAEDLTFLQDASVDLITVATAFHWMDAEQVYKEAQRVLKPRGVLAIYLHGLLAMDHAPSNDIIKKVNFQFSKTFKDSGCRHEKVEHMLNNYVDVPPMPFDDVCRYEDLQTSRTLKLKEVIGIMTTWSTFQTYMRKFPGSTLAEETASEFRDLHGSDDVIVDVKWPLFLQIGNNSC